MNADRLIVEATPPKPASIMITLAPTTQTAGTAKRVSIGCVCKTAAAIAVVAMISVPSIAQLTRAHLAPTVATDSTQPPELRCY